MHFVVRIAQISDLHVRRASAKEARQFDAWLTQCIASVNAAAPDLVIVTGDLTESGDEQEYQRLRELMGALAAPYFLLPGNHDDPQALRDAFPDRPYLFENEAHVSYAVDMDGVRFIALDSTKRGRAGGYLDIDRLAWLQLQLGVEPPLPVLLALHHPPFAAGVWPMDWLGFTNVRELEAMVRANPHVRRVVSGHVHCARASTWAGTFACTSPSIRPQRLLIGVGWQPPSLHFERAGFLMHAMDGGDMRTTVHRIDGSVETLEG